jgi:hypothetical protein
MRRVGQTDARRVLGAQRAAASHLGHNGHLVRRLGGLRRRQSRRRRRIAHAVRRLAPGGWVFVVVLGRRGAGLAGPAALMALPLAVSVLVLGARGAALAVRVLLAAAAVRV